MVGESSPLDDLEVVRAVVAAIEPFEPEDRNRIMRWASEKLGLSSAKPPGTAPPPPPDRSDTGIVSHQGQRRDLRSFITDKQPGSDTQFTAAVAYYYAFEAPEADRKATVSGQDLIEACRLANRSRLANPSATLNNALRDGYLDRVETGSYRVNSVGENLVAMALPAKGEGEATRAVRSGSSRTRKTATKKTPSKRTPAKRTAPKGTPSGRSSRR